jgi:hypothetical protein
VSEPSEPPNEASETRESNRRLVLSEDLPLTIFVGVATAVVFSLIDLGREWTLLGVATAPLAADAIKHHVQARGWTKRRLVFLTALLVFFGRVKEALARPFRRGSRPPEPPAGRGGGGTRWSAVATTAAIGSALTIVFFTIPEVARGDALLADRETTFFGGDRPDRAEDAGTSTEPEPPPPPPPPSPSPPPPPPPPPTGPEVALTVMIVGKGMGKVLIEPVGSRCQPNCAATVPQGNSVTLTAEPAEGSAFVGWKVGGCGTAESCVVVMSKDQNVFAQFELLPTTFTLTVAIELDGGDGTVKSDSNRIDCLPTCSNSFAEGTSVTLIAEADSSSDFAGWTGDCNGSSRSCTLVMDADKSVTARFVVESPD